MTTEIEDMERLLEKLRAFLASLDDQERRALAALLGPGIALAHESPLGAGGDGSDDAEDVIGFGAGWSRGSLPAHLAAAIRNSGLRIEGI